MGDLLIVKNVVKRFGAFTAVDGLSFNVRKGEILGLIGPNGAGKTTVFNLLMGNMMSDEGSMFLEGREITNDSPTRRSRLGLSRTFQIPRPFEKMTLFENLLVAALFGGHKSEVQARKEVSGILELIGLAGSRNILAGKLPLLDRKRLELGRALATDPELLCLDEIAGGLTDQEAEQVLDIIRKINDKGVSIIWIEHLLAMILEGVDRLLAIAEGRWIGCGNPKEVLNSEEVIAHYLGVEEE